MNETVIRKETYGLIVFNPRINGYYRVYDNKLQQEILNKNFNYIKQNYKTEFYELGLDIENKRYVDNSIFGNEVFVPLEAYFDYTALCNRNCAYCYNKKFLGNTTMTEESVRHVFDSFYELGIMRVHLAGGEPTINYLGLKNYIEYGRSKGMRISLATNGTFLDDNKISELLTTNDLISVSVSLDNADPKKNDGLRGDGSFEKVLEGVKNLKEHKKKNNSNLEICYKPVYFPTITNNEIESLIKMAEKYGLDKVKFANPERCDEHELGYYGSQKKLYYDSIKRIQNIIERGNYKVSITNVTNPALYDFIIGIEENRGCIGAQELITINPDGRITPCLMNHYKLGNIYDYSDLKEFLTISDKLKKYRKMISSYNCNNCKNHFSCRGGCQVRKKVEYGAIKNNDPLCPKNLCEEKEQKVLKKNIRKINVYHSL